MDCLLFAVNRRVRQQSNIAYTAWTGHNDCEILYGLTEIFIEVGYAAMHDHYCGTIIGSFLATFLLSLFPPYIIVRKVTLRIICSLWMSLLASLK